MRVVLESIKVRYTYNRISIHIKYCKTKLSDVRVQDETGCGNPREKDQPLACSIPGLAIRDHQSPSFGIEGDLEGGLYDLKRIVSMLSFLHHVEKAVCSLNTLLQRFAFADARRSASEQRDMLRRYGRQTRYADFECIGHRRELCVVCEVGMEEVLGLGNAA